MAAWGDETIPPQPPGYFTDYAGVAPGATASRLNEELATFERETSSQILVAIYPKMQSDAEIADYTLRVFRSWKVGQKDKNNGAVPVRFCAGPQVFHDHGLWAGGGVAGCVVQDDHGAGRGAAV